MTHVTPAYGNKVEQGGLLGDIFGLPMMAMDQVRDLGDALSQASAIEQAKNFANEETYDLTPPEPTLAPRR